MVDKELMQNTRETSKQTTLQSTNNFLLDFKLCIKNLNWKRFKGTLVPSFNLNCVDMEKCDIPPPPSPQWEHHYKACQFLIPTPTLYPPPLKGHTYNQVYKNFNFLNYMHIAMRFNSFVYGTQKYISLLFWDGIYKHLTTPTHC